MPEVGKGEVLVRVSRTALCGSDFKLWHKGAEFTAGHEIFGVVEQPGHADARQALRGLYPAALRALRRLPARRHPDVPGGFQPDRLEPARAAMRNMCRCRKIACCRCPTISRTGWRRCCSTPSAPRRHAVRFVEPHRAARRVRTGAGDRRRARSALVSCWRCKSLGYDDIRVSDPNAARLKIAQSVRREAASGRRYRAALRADHRMLRRACRAQSRHRGRAAARRAGAGRRERRALDHRGRQGVSPQGFLHDPHLLFSDRRLRAEYRAAAPVQGRISRAGRRRIRPVDLAREFRALRQGRD